MSAANRGNDSAHVGPAGGAYEEQQKALRERNDQARQVAKQERADTERRAAATRRDADRRDNVYR